ncbi:MAG TPA: extracellular solute-binding protein [Phycisphaerales bacterium]|nr:extracellular solute-binding protein [Phycisphaerales bacterium]
MARAIGSVAIVTIAAWFGIASHRSIAAAPTREVVLYVSADDVIARPIVERFERETGIRVRMQGDTEATKTTGLVQRLRSERESPRADVFWSSEVFLTIALARDGLLAPFDDPSLADWPASMRDPQRRWHGFGLRARVLVYNTSRVKPDEAPREMLDLAANARWRGRVVMARPAFGTTRGHMAALVAMWGEPAARQFLEMLHEQDVRLLDGNSAVVRAVTSGEADVGLTDTDDVWSGQKLGWPVDLVYIRHDRQRGGGNGEPVRAGPLLIPNTVSIINGAPHPEEARELARYLLGEGVERMLAESDSRNIPIRPALASEFPTLAVAEPAELSYESISNAMAAAMTICREVFGP